MALTQLQKDVMAIIAANRSETSYMAGGAVLNRDWFRISDDLDIFQDTDEQIVATARADMAALEVGGFTVTVDVLIYGVVECTVSRNQQSTMLQWMSETRFRFFPLVRDPEWGVRLHMADLAVNKVLAAASRSKARDYIDLMTIAARFSPLGSLVLAASGKPPNFSPQRIVDEIRRRSQSLPAEDYMSIRGLPLDLTIEQIRGDIAAMLDRAETYIHEVELVLVGHLAVDTNHRPIEVHGKDLDGVSIRRATAESETVAALKDEPEWP